MNHSPLKYLLLSLLTLAAMGGASVASAKEATANLAAFADQTVALLGQPDYGLTSDEVVLVRGYYDPNHPAVKKLHELSQRGANLFAALGDYSVQIAGLSGQRISEAERIQRLRSYLQEAKPDILAATEFQSARYDQILESLAEQESFLAAIREVQPVINAVGRYGQLLISDYENTVLEVRDVLDAAIAEDYAVVIRYTEALERRHGETLQQVTILVDSESPSGSEEKALAAKLERMQRIFEFLEPRWELYQATLKELSDLHTKAFQSSGRERVALLLWVRAHQRMAAGLEGSSWFNYGDLIGDALNL